MEGKIQQLAEILIAASDPSRRTRMRKTLEEAGFAVVAAANGEEALEKFKTGDPDVVLLDTNLPKMDGFEVCRAIRQIPAGQHKPILLVVGAGKAEAIRRAFESGASDFISRSTKGMSLGYRVQFTLRTARAAQFLKENQEKLEFAQRISRLGYWEWNFHQHHWTFSEESRQILGLTVLPPNDLSAFLSSVHPEERVAVENALSRALSGELEFNVEHRIIRSDGQIRYVHVQGQVVRDSQGLPIRIAGTIQDVTDRLQTATSLRENEARLNHLAYHDALTGLPNRLLFQDRFRHAIVKAHRSRKQVAILFMDLDQFKRVNDSFGHDVGDQLLRAVADRLRACAREGDTVARIGGDEFVLLLDVVDQVKAVGSVAKKVNVCLTPAFHVGGVKFHVTASIGIGIYPDNGGSVEELMKCADVAMYRAKEGGGNHFQFFTTGRNSMVRELGCMTTEATYPLR